MRCSHRSSLALATLLFGSFVRVAALASETEARLVVPPGVEKTLKSTLSLPVKALPVGLNQPVRKGELLAEIDVTKLEKELDGIRKTLVNAQAQRRRLATERGATSRVPASQSRQDLATAQAVSNAEMAESTALSDLTSVQTRIASASVRAPADGYVVKHFYAVGAKAKRRQPFLVFAESGKTSVEAAIPASDAAAFATGAEVRIVSAEDAAKSFRGKVTSATPVGETVALQIQPLELPFLELGSAARATLSVIR